MPSIYSDLKIELIATGEQSGTWGDTTNTNLGTALEEAIVGRANANFPSDADLTITLANTNATQVARNYILNVTSAVSLSTTRNLIVPTIDKPYIVENNTTGGQSIVVKTSAGTGVTVPNGKTMMVYADSTNVVSAFNNLPTGTTIGGATVGNVEGPASSTDNAVARFDGTTGKIVQNSAVTIADDGTTVISTNSSSDALRITQTGTGNALLVEDSTNPDSTPFVVDASGNTVVGYTSPIAPSGLTASQLSVFGTTSAAGSTVGRYSADANPPEIRAFKSRSTTIGSYSTVSSGDSLGRVNFFGDDGTAFVRAAQIDAAVDGTPGTNDMPGRLVFSTTADGASVPTERMRIDNQGRIGFNSSSLGGASGTYRFAGNITGAVSSSGVVYTPTVQSDVTTSATVFGSQPSTQDAAFALTNLFHFATTQGTITGGSRTAPANQYGFHAGSTLTGATNNYGFHSNIAAGTGRWNFFAAGTAENYFGGNTVINVTDNTNAALRITQLGTGNALVVEDSANPDATPFVIDASGNVTVGSLTRDSTGTVNAKTQLQAGDGTSASIGQYTWNVGAASAPYHTFNKSRGATVGTRGVVASGDELGNIYFAGDDGTNFIRTASIQAFVDGTPGTNDMPGRLVFSTTADGASNPTERLRIDSSGNVGIGTTSPAVPLQVDSADSTQFRVQATTNGVDMRVTAIGLTGNAGQIGTWSNHPVIVRTNNIERMRIDNAGNVGIGTATPVARFDLVGDYKEGVVTANTGTTYTINTATGTVQILTLTGNCTFTFPTAVAGESFTLLLRQDGTGSRTVTWPANVRWPGGTAPTITATASRQDKYVFTADGTNWYGSNAGQNYTV